MKKKRKMITVECPEKLIIAFQRHCEEEAQTVSAKIRRFMLESIRAEKKEQECPLQNQQK